MRLGRLAYVRLLRIIDIEELLILGVGLANAFVYFECLRVCVRRSDAALLGPDALLLGLAGPLAGRCSGAVSRGSRTP